MATPNAVLLKSRRRRRSWWLPKINPLASFPHEIVFGGDDGSDRSAPAGARAAGCGREIHCHLRRRAGGREPGRDGRAKPGAGWAAGGAGAVAAVSNNIPRLESDRKSVVEGKSVDLG